MLYPGFLQLTSYNCYLSSTFETKLLESFVKLMGVTVPCDHCPACAVVSTGQEIILLFSSESSVAIREKREVS